MKITELTQDMVGKKVTCRINGTDLTDAKIQYGYPRGRDADDEVGKRFFICSNEKDGSDADDKLGYQYSWEVDEGTQDALRRNEVSNLELLEPIITNNYDIY